MGALNTIHHGDCIPTPFPWFGGKSRAASLIWERVGNVQNYIEPFAGSLAVLLRRPHAAKTETVNDLDCYLVNFWRAVTHAPGEVERYADYPVTEADMIARHRWLMSRDEFRQKMYADPDYYDPKIAGWWVWGVNIWIGDGWCKHDAEQLPHLGNPGRGVHRRLPHLGDSGTGVLTAWFNALAERLRRVRVACGDWRRVLTPSVTTKQGITGVLLDPPYSSSANQAYAFDTGEDVADAVRTWAVVNGDNPNFRIALCGYAGDYEMPDGWDCVPWKAGRGYRKCGDNGEHSGHNERIWFSPHCIKPELPLFAGLSA